MQGCPDVTVITVTYRSAHLVPALASTLAHFAHVCVVDNASDDTTVALLKNALPQATLIQHRTNLGFGAANNAAVLLATTPYVLLLNPDADIDVASVHALMDAMRQYPRAGMVAPQVWLPDGHAQQSYKEAFFEPTAKNVAYEVPQGICSSKWLTGSCLLARTDVFQQIAGFDEGFFLYYEDDDLCLRMHQSGWECLLQPSARATHIGGGGSAPSWRTELFKHHHYALSRRRMIYKYLGSFASWCYLLKTLLAAPLAILIYTLLARKKYVLKWLGWGYSCLKPLNRVQQKWRSHHAAP
jgi:N-acetylglucosaminyl-diphospho-decaprenol L-rhamnosyltransferase